VPVFELYFITQFFIILGLVALEDIEYFDSEFILGRNIINVSSNVMVNCRAFLS